MKETPLRALDRPIYNFTAIRGRAERVRERTQRRPHRLRPAEIAFLAAFALAAVVFVGLAFDDLSVRRARELYPVVRSFFSFVSWLGQSQWELIPAGVLVIVLFFGDWTLLPARVRAAWAEVGAISAYIFLSIAGSGILVNIVKQPIGRGRPPTYDEYGPFVLHPFKFIYNFQSFPSGHSTTAGCLIAIGVLALPRLRVPLIVFALLVGGSRVMVQAHYPSDVLAGLLVGYCFSLWLAGRFADAGWAFARGSTGLISARAAAVADLFRSAAGIAIFFSGLLDALAGRRIWLPALQSIGRKGELPPSRPDDLDET